MTAPLAPPAGIVARNPFSTGTFAGGNQTAASLLAFGAAIAATSTTTASPTAGGTLHINGQSCGSYDYHIINGPVTLSSFTSSSWFTATEDTRSAIVVVRGNLTVNAGVTVTPANRKLFAFLYVTGTLTVNGTISMSARGANHSGTGSSGGLTSPVAIRLAAGTYQNVQSTAPYPTITDPAIPATGGSGGAGRTTVGLANSGATVTLGTGGGGGGSMGIDTTVNAGFGSGSGAAGTCFSGGAGGGGFSDFFNSATTTAGNGVANGGSGGTGVNAAGGTGNPYVISGGNANASGTGGVLVVYALTSITGSGSLTADGVSQTNTASSPAPNSGKCGGASGGGVVAAFTTSVNFANPTITANGGTAVSSGGTANDFGGAGGNGWAGRLLLP